MELSPEFGEVREETTSSTPVTHIPTRKRKHDDTLEAYPPSPKFSSTFNESLISNFKDFGLDGSLPNTPEKQLKKMTKSVVASPIEESRRILYTNIKIVKPERRVNKTKQVCFGTQNLLREILNIDVITDVIFKYLSGGDLYRFSLVSDSFRKALERNKNAFGRYKIYKMVYRDNKENYVITPPGSPEKCDSPPRTSSENFNKYIRAATKLTRSQSLTKCRKCEGVAIVDNEISQCQNVNACGLIYCLLCSSSSETGPRDFEDKCGHAVLRPKLGNVSNHMEESFYSLNFSQQDSGFYSENESPAKVRRNLFATETPKTLSVVNRNKLVLSQKRKEQVCYVPVVLNPKKSVRQTECDSPPRLEYAVGSQRSKRNLKRLTR